MINVSHVSTFRVVPRDVKREACLCIAMFDERVVSDCDPALQAVWGIHVRGVTYVMLLCCCYTTSARMEWKISMLYNNNNNGRNGSCLTWLATS